MDLKQHGQKLPLLVSLPSLPLPIDLVKMLSPMPLMMLALMLGDQRPLQLLNL